MTADKVFKIASIPGDGIGQEVVPEGIRVLDASPRRPAAAFAFELPSSPGAASTTSRPAG